MIDRFFLVVNIMIKTYCIKTYCIKTYYVSSIIITFFYFAKKRSLYRLPHPQPHLPHQLNPPDPPKELAPDDLGAAEYWAKVLFIPAIVPAVRYEPSLL